MKLSQRTRISILVVGDIIALYAALAAALYLRYGNDFANQFVLNHFRPFTFIFLIWLLVFYVAGLYDPRRLRNNIDFAKTLSLALAVNVLITVALFYLVPAFGIAPKTNLFLFIVILVTIEAWWRHSFNMRLSFRDGLVNILLLDRSPRAGEINAELKNPHLGYTVVAWPERGWEGGLASEIQELVGRHAVNLVVVPAKLKHDATTRRALYELLTTGIEILDLPAFYEMVLRKIPLADIDESWFVDHHLGRHDFYDDLKRAGEFLAALCLGLVLLPIELLIALGVKISSPGPVIYRQTRIGKGTKSFTLYKFRSMKALAADGSAETNGAAWTRAKDERTTFFGKFLRASHLDELPQLVNILRNELSFVGPRPERPEFVKVIEGEVPYYDIRHLVKPGITGWAQINYRYGASVDDAYRKLEYDLYYLKNRSLIMDVAIILKTLKSFFINQK
ncbi:MAG: sugar transferase [Patescibacteria group bacterium]